LASRVGFLEELTIRNFQSWKLGVFYFSSGINTFSGSSDAGKSAAVRALEWLVENECGSFEEEARSWDCKAKDVTSVFARFSCGSTVERRRSMGGVNEYVINGKETFKALRGKVPAEVREILGMNEVNIQTQDQNYFLLDKPSGQVAKELNAVADLAGMDTTVTNINKRIKETVKQIKSTRTDIKGADEILVQLDYLDDCDIALQRVEKREENMAAIQKRKEDMSRAIAGVSTAAKAFAAMPDVKKLRAAFARIAKFAPTIEEARINLLRNTAVLNTSISLKAELEACPEIPEDFHEDCKYMVAQQDLLNKALTDADQLSNSLARVNSCTPPAELPAGCKQQLNEMLKAEAIVHEVKVDAAELRMKIKEASRAQAAIKKIAKEKIAAMFSLEEAKAEADTCSECGRPLC